MKLEKNCKKNLFLAMSFLFIFSIGFALGAEAITIVAPASDGGVSSSFVLNMTFTSDEIPGQNQTDIYWEIPGISSSNTSIVTALANYSGSDIYGVYNYTWDTTGLTDMNNITIWFNLTNGTAGFNGNVTPVEGVDLDNGVPTATLSGAHFPTLAKYAGGDTFTVAINADNTIGIDNCLIFFTNTQTNTVDNVSLVAPSSNACSWSPTPADITGLTAGEVYSVVIEAQDNNFNKTNSSDRAFQYKGVSGAPVTVGGGGESGFSKAVTSVSNATSKTFGGIFGAITKFVDWFSGLFQ